MKFLPENILKRMDQADRKALGKAGRTWQEITATNEHKSELDLHNDFINWLRRNQVHYIHANPTRRSTIREGAPDFYCMREGRVICIEFKVGHNYLSETQKAVVVELTEFQIPVFVCHDYETATSLVAKYFHITNNES
jgi:hypothetical protein